MFEIGEKVLCVNDISTNPVNSYWHKKKLIGLDAGKVYTIAAVVEDKCFLQEVMNDWTFKRSVGPYRTYQDRGFGNFRFRKLIKKKTDISIFHKILDRAGKNVPALIE